MAKALKTVGMIAGAVALVATAALTFGGTAFLASGLGAALGGTGGIAAVSGLVAGVANVGATLLQKPPRSQGSVSQVLISPEAPRPYAMGEGLVGGVLRYQKSYGATLKKVPRPYRWMVIVYSGGGECEEITPWVDQEPVSSWYSGFLYTDTQLGACPESTALAPFFAGPPGWDSSSKLSGKAAIGWNLLFDKDGKRFASGVPQIAAYGKWEKVYDPRLDDTFAGGEGDCRLGDEETYVWSENPALHAGTYAYGRYQNGLRVMGVGLPADGIDWICIAAWANVCEANAWTLFGVVYEPGDRWANLKDIAAAGGAQPVPSSGGKLSFLVSAPKVALDTITEADLVDGSISVGKVASFRDRFNTITPKYRSPDHAWEMVPAVSFSDEDLVAEDGEEKKVEWPFNLVKDVDQDAQLGAYRIYDSREEQPVTIPCGPRLRHYRPGECLTLDLPEKNLTYDAVILTRQFDPASLTVTLSFMSETAGKHALALAAIGTAPTTPESALTGQERDEIAGGVTGAGELSPNTGFYAVDAVGAIEGGWSNSASDLFDHSELWAGPTADFADASQLGADFTGVAGAAETFSETLAAGAWFVWTLATDAGGATVALTGPIAVTVT